MAKGNLAPVEDEKVDASSQLALFEGTAVHEYRASLTAAGYLELEDELHVGKRVSISGEGVVSKVIFHQHKGIVTRQHVIVVDAETVDIIEK